MSTLVDTSILTRSVHRSDPMHPTAVDAVDRLRQQGESLCLVPQNFYEFWVVCSRPTTQNGLGMSPAQVVRETDQLERLFVLHEDSPALFRQWRQIVSQYQVVGKNGHDARLVAAMNIHAIDKLLTFNTRDFQRYQGIVILSPQDVLAGP